MTIFQGNGDGTFRQGQVLTPGKNPSSKYFSIAVADLNGDQRLDLVVVNSGDETFSVMLGNGNGTFQPPVAYTLRNPPPQSIFVADLAGNGAKDLVVFRLVGVSIWLANGDGTFHQGFGTGGFGETHGDFDGDGHLDLAAYGSPIQILPGNGDGTVKPPITLNSTGELTQVLDVNGDSAPDLVTISNSSIGLLVNVGTDFSISASGLNPASLSAGQSATSSLTLKLLSNFSNPVSLTCAVQPAQPGAPTCSLSSSSLTFDANGEANATLTIGAGSSAASMNFLSPFSRGSLLWLPVAGFAFLGTGLCASSERRIRILMFSIGAIISLGIITQTACGGSGSSGNPKSNPYTVTVTATSEATQHSTTVNLTVQ